LSGSPSSHFTVGVLESHSNTFSIPCAIESVFQCLFLKIFWMMN
jgi:hypothetical protein